MSLLARAPRYRSSAGWLAVALAPLWATALGRPDLVPSLAITAGVVAGASAWFFAGSRADTAFPDPSDHVIPLGWYAGWWPVWAVLLAGRPELGWNRVLTVLGVLGGLGGIAAVLGSMRAHAGRSSAAAFAALWTALAASCCIQLGLSDESWARRAPQLAGWVFHLSPLTQLAEAAGVDWARHPAVYHRAGTDWFSAGRSPMAPGATLAGAVLLVVGCCLARRIERRSAER